MIAKRINFESLINREVKVLSGREKGQDFRLKRELDQLDSQEETVEIIVPKDIYSINASFFLGMFGPSIRQLGESKFREKYKFICDQVIMKNVEDGISRALKDSNVLGPTRACGR